MKGLIGNTPMLKLYYRYQNQVDYIYVKVEYFNLTGSIKDRIAYRILKRAKEEGKLREKMPIVEATSGNTGISFSALGPYFHHPVVIFMPDWVSLERVQLMRLYGAEVHLISKEEGGFQACIDQSKQMAKRLGGFCPRQFENQENVLAHYEETGREILDQIPEPIGGFISGIGTGGTLMGVGKRLKEKDRETKVIALEPAESPLLSQGYASSHLLEGIGDDFIPELVDRDLIDEIHLVSSNDAICMAQKLSQLGLGVGITSGANVLLAIQTNGKRKNVTVCPDDSKKYLSTMLTKPLESKLVSSIELLNFEIIEA